MQNTCKTLAHSNSRKMSHKCIYPVFHVLKHMFEDYHEISVPISTRVVSWNPAHGGVYLIQQYVIKFVSDLRQVSGFLWLL